MVVKTVLPTKAKTYKVDRITKVKLAKRPSIDLTTIKGVARFCSIIRDYNLQCLKALQAGRKPVTQKAFASKYGIPYRMFRKYATLDVECRKPVRLVVQKRRLIPVADLIIFATEMATQDLTEWVLNVRMKVRFKISYKQAWLQLLKFVFPMIAELLRAYANNFSSDFKKYLYLQIVPPSKL